jgi:hypothetical protein
VHRDNHVLSQLPAPSPEVASQFTPVSVPQRRPSEIIAQHGNPHYVKIDVEHYDQHVLSDIFAAGFLPRFISAEAHSVEIFCLLVAAGYRAFNVVNGSTVVADYANVNIATAKGVERYSFQAHSAGPYGEDITSPWLDSQSCFYRLAGEGFGWRDIHATSAIQPSAAVKLPVPILSVRQAWLALVESAVRSARRRLTS